MDIEEVSSLKIIRRKLLGLSVQQLGSYFRSSQSFKLVHQMLGEKNEASYLAEVHLIENHFVGMSDAPESSYKC